MCSQSYLGLCDNRKRYIYLANTLQNYDDNENYLDNNDKIL